MKPVAIYWKSDLILIMQPAQSFLLQVLLLPCLKIKPSSLTGLILTIFFQVETIQWIYMIYGRQVRNKELVIITTGLILLRFVFISGELIILLSLILIITELICHWLLLTLMSPAILLMVMIVARLL